jgi:chromosome segregation ATPase
MRLQETFDTVARRHNTGLGQRTDMLLEIDELAHRIKTTSQREKDVYDRTVLLRKELHTDTLAVKRKHDRLEFMARTAENEAARLRLIHEKRDRKILDRLEELQYTLETLRVDTSDIRAELGPLDEQRLRYATLQGKLKSQQAEARRETRLLQDKERGAIAELEEAKVEHAKQLASLREAEDHCEAETKDWRRKERDVALNLRGIQRKADELHKERDRQLRVTEDLAARAREAQDDMQTKVGRRGQGAGGVWKREMREGMALARTGIDPEPHLYHIHIGCSSILGCARQRYDGGMPAAAE